ncbi:MAG: flagellar protein FlaG [Nitrospinae bacterium]|nr:flagellar protein FlaG [Nitrospinota bacterium]
MDAEFLQVSGVSPVQTSPPRARTEKSNAVPSPAVEPPGTEDTVTLSKEGRVAAEKATVRDPGAESKKVDNQNDHNVERRFDLTDNQEVVLKLVDPRTSRVVKQIPQEEQLKLRAAIQDSVEILTKPRPGE